jgi:proteasome lid subunit RPN8/RPN11
MEQVDVPGLNRRVRRAIYDHVFENADHEVGGILVGRLGGGPLPVVTGCIAALEADGQRASVTFTHDAWDRIYAVLERDFAGDQIVGWYHSHPGFGIFLSSYDHFIHDNFFSDPRQIAYVVDPHAGTEGVFSWQEEKLLLMEERPTGRRGTDGERTRYAGQQSRVALPASRTDRLRYGASATVIVLLVGLAIVLLSTGRATPNGRNRKPAAPRVSRTQTGPDGTGASPLTAAPHWLDPGPNSQRSHP